MQYQCKGGRLASKVLYYSGLSQRLLEEVPVTLVAFSTHGAASSLSRLPLLPFRHQLVKFRSTRDAYKHAGAGAAVAPCGALTPLAAETLVVIYSI